MHTTRFCGFGGGYMPLWSHPPDTLPYPFTLDTIPLGYPSPHGIP